MSSAAAGWIASVCLGLLGPDATREPSRLAADSVTLRDGKTVLGVLVEPAPKGATWLYVRRAWGREHLPAWADRWETAEAPAVKKAVVQRRARLERWRRERRAAPAPEADDRILAWIDRELARLDSGAAAKSAVMTVKLGRGDVRSDVRPARGASRLLRLAWLAKLPDPERMKADDLGEALEGRGFDPSGQAPVSIDALLPPQPETDAAWLVRRAATEVSYDPGLKFIRYGTLVLPEPEPGQPPPPGAGMLAVSALKDLLGENPVDPLPARLREVEARGRRGAVVTRMEIAPDVSGVSVEIALWVRQAPGRWAPVGSRSARAGPDDLGPDAANGLADDPQVSLALRIIEGIGLGGVSPELKQRALGIGAAAQRAIGLARSAAQDDLSALALPVSDTPRDAKPEPGKP